MSARERQMTLAELLPEAALTGPVRALQIRGLTNDSRRVRPGDLFIACRGERFDGADFLPQALGQGAVAVLAEPGAVTDCAVPLIERPDLNADLSALAGRFYGCPSRGLHCIGITGTNGKTSISHFVARALTALGTPAALIGTNGYGFPDRLERASHTTPDSLRLQQLLADLRDQGAEAATLEVSSHALEQGRVAGVAFDQAVFTNLTRDHLDYHGTMAAYGAAKVRLFQDYGIRRAVINVDDPFGARLIDQLPAGVERLGYGASPAADLRVRDCRLSAAGIDAAVDTPWGAIQLRSPLLGRFNLDNLLATLGVLLGAGHPLASALAVLERLGGVEGRMQAIPGADGALVVIDYAHTPDALEKALASLRGHCRGRLACLFGCGGDRDRGKRPQMAAIAERLADRLVVTSDNPRGESPGAIIDEILSGLTEPASALVEPDRARAIAAAVGELEAGDILLVAGKGHEDYQEIAGVRHSFSDAAVVRDALAAGGDHA